MDESHEQHLERMLRHETKGEFEIERLLGKGGMALVYLAKEVHLDRKVAIKVLPPELTFGHGVERFKREAKTAAALDHPHIIPIHRIASGGKLFWYTMKYVEGRSLEDYLKEHNTLSLEQTIQILEPVADALAYAHENHVIHRDIKPANVMLDERNRVTVADFGIAKALTEATLTASGSVIGTPYYMSPEQGMGKVVSGASDQYSVAVMAYRMLSGQVPFDGDSAIDILHKHCKEPPPPLNVLTPNLPRHVYAAIDKALSKNPDDRFSTVTAFVRGLKQMSPEISAEMDTVAMDSDPSIQDKISTEVIGIRDENLSPEERRAETEQAATEATTGGIRKKKTPWLALVPLAIATIGGGVVGGWWLSTSQGGTEPADQATRFAAGAQVAAESTAVGTPPVAIPPVPSTGTVTVTGLPAAGRITVNGERQADTIFELEPGTYAIGLSAPDQQDVETELTITAGAQFAVPFLSASAQVTSGTVVVTDLPSGGEIRVDGRRQRQPTFELERGRYTIRLTAPGYQAVERPLSVTAGTGVTVQFTGLPVVAAVSVTPARPEVSVGDEVTVRARPVDVNGNALSGRQVRWVSGNTSIATVTQSGMIRGVAEGSTPITATVEDQSASVNVRVMPVGVEAVNVTPVNSEVFEGETISLNASVVDESGRPMSGQAVTWLSSDLSVATVTAAGVVTGVKAGSARVTARSGGQAGSAVVTVKTVEVTEQTNPQAPARRPISGPEDLFSRAAPEGWRVVRGTAPVIAVFNHQELGTIRIFRAPEASQEAILLNLRTRLEDRMTSLRELAPPEPLTTAGGESILIQRFDGREGSSFAETRWSVILAAAKNDARAVGVVALITYYADREQAAADVRELLRSLRQ
jgi:serine/threonine protein kinase